MPNDLLERNPLPWKLVIDRKPDTSENWGLPPEILTKLMAAYLTSFQIPDRFQ